MSMVVDEHTMDKMGKKGDAIPLTRDHVLAQTCSQNVKDILRRRDQVQV